LLLFVPICCTVFFMELSSPETPGLTGGLEAHELNPRKITSEQLSRLQKSMERFGDLSGVIRNRTTRRLIGGHQRTKVFGADARIELKATFDKPDATGTIALGYIYDKDGNPHAFREVKWPAHIEYAAMIAANAHGGEWEETKLKEVLVLISESEDAVDSDLLGLEQEEMESLFKGEELKLNVQEQENRALTKPLTSEEVELLPSQTAMVQLFMTVTTRPDFILKCKELQNLWGTANVTETVVRAIERVHAETKSKVATL
jgi:hypothetical protein